MGEGLGRGLSVPPHPEPQAAGVCSAGPGLARDPCVHTGAGEAGDTHVHTQHTHGTHWALGTGAGWVGLSGAGARTRAGPVHTSPPGLLPARLPLLQPTPEPRAPRESGGPSLPNKTNRL